MDGVQWTLLVVYLLGIPPSAYLLIWLDANHANPTPVLSLLVSVFWPIIIPVVVIAEVVVTLSWAMHESAAERRFGESKAARRLGNRGGRLGRRRDPRGGRAEK